jgi:exosortase/archaeosortase family protein
MRVPKISRIHLLPLLFAVAIVNPFTYYVLHVSRTYFWVVPLTVLIWFIFKWDDLMGARELVDRPRTWEILVACILLGGVLARDLMQSPDSRIFGLFDMLVLFVALSIMLFGIRSLRRLWVPAAFLAIIGVGYSLEKMVVDSMGYSDWLAGAIVSIVRLMGGNAQSQGSIILLPDHGPGRLLVDYGCTGIKGVMAFAFISFIPILESRRSHPAKALWVIGALAGFYLASILRLVAVVFAVMAWGQIAVDYHTTIGFGFFMTWLVLVTYFATSPVPEAYREDGGEGTSTDLAQH